MLFNINFFNYGVTINIQLKWYHSIVDFIIKESYGAQIDWLENIFMPNKFKMPQFCSK